MSRILAYTSSARGHVLPVTPILDERRRRLRPRQPASAVRRAGRLPVGQQQHVGANLARLDQLQLGPAAPSENSRLPYPSIHGKTIR